MTQGNQSEDDIESYQSRTKQGKDLLNESKGGGVGASRCVGGKRKEKKKKGKVIFQ